MNIVLGCAQFGQNYGIANRSGRPSLLEVGAILELALEKGIEVLDTAAAYGDSEKVLGEIGVEQFRVVSKIPKIPQDVVSVRQWVTEVIENSLNDLKVNSLHACLIHHGDDLLGDRRDELLEGIHDAKSNKLIENGGFSIYKPTTIPELCDALKPEIIQAPFNVFDQRLVTGNWVRRIEELGCELHARSIFLQGLLLMHRNDLGRYFTTWSNVFCAWEKFVERSGYSAVELCLAAARLNPAISNVVIGVDNAMQLREIFSANSAVMSIDVSHLSCDDEGLIDPSRWRLEDA